MRHASALALLALLSCKHPPDPVLTDGGLYYGNAVEFAAALDFLIDHPDAAKQLGRQGLAYVDREPGAKAFPGATLEDVLKEQKAERAEVEDYYLRAGENSARIVYFRGMIWGTFALAAVVGGGFLLGWWVGWLNPHDGATKTLFVTVAMGAAGAILSVMTRMARRDGFNLEFEVGRKSMRYLGALRPWIGGMFALAVYVAFKSSLIDLLPDVPHDIYFYATVGFLSGFSERRAKVLLDSTGVGSDTGAATAPK